MATFTLRVNGETKTSRSSRTRPSSTSCATISS